MAASSPRIALLHHVSGANLGDGATIDAVVQNIRSRWPAAVIMGLSMNPEDTARRHGIPSYPIRQKTWGFGIPIREEEPGARAKIKIALRRYETVLKLLKVINAFVVKAPLAFVRELAFLAKSYRVARKIDLLVICGGGQLLESSGGPWAFLGGPWNFPYTIFKWTLLARLAGARCVVLNIGAGPLVTRLGKFFVRSTLRMASYTSFRDVDSKDVVQSIGFDRPAFVFPDSAYSLQYAVPKRNVATKEDAKVVGFAPMAYGDPRMSLQHSQAAYAGFVRQLGTFGSWLIRSGFCLTLFCTDIGVDPPVIEDVETLLKTNRQVHLSEIHRGGSLTRVHQWSTEDVLTNMSSMDYVVTCRFHAVVFASMLNIPVLAIGHHPKVTALMNDLGLGRYCVDVRDCSLTRLTDAFEALVDDHHEIKDQMAEKLIAYRKQLGVQFDQLFPAARANASSFTNAPRGVIVPSPYVTRLVATQSRKDT
jgi:polysaccharide pyruvyl transferase WcaK-like protein